MSTSTSSSAAVPATGRTTAPNGGGPSRVPLAAIGGLLVATVLAVAGVRLTGIGMVRTPQAPEVTVRELRFEDRPDGSIVVQEAKDGRLVDTIAPGTNGFLRGTLRGMARERTRQGVGAAPPFRLAGHADGHLTLDDPATGRRIDLGSFGPTNAEAFARLLTAPRS